MTEKVALKELLAIVALSVVAFSGIMAETAMNVTFTVLSQEFNRDLNMIQWVTTLYLLAVTIMITTSAFLIKRFNSRWLWLSSVFIFLIGTLLSGFAPTLTWLLIGRILEGIAAGIAMPLVCNYVVDVVPAQHVGTYMGLASLVIGLAPSFGPTYGGALVEILGWRSIFFILLIAPFVSLLLGWWTIGKIKQPPITKSFDAVAFALLAVSLTAALLVVNKLESGTLNWAYLSLAVIMLLAFIRRSNTSQKVFLNLKLLTQLKFTALLIAISLYMFVMLGLNLIIPTYLQNVQHTSSFWAGFALLPGTLLGAFFNPLFGRMYDKTGAKTPIYIGHSVFTITVIVLTILTKQLSLILVIVLYILFILGRNMSYTNAQTAAIAEQADAVKSDATAIIQSTQMFMGALGTTVAALFQSHGGVLIGFGWFNLLAISLSLLIFGLLIFYFKSAR